MKINRVIMGHLSTPNYLNLFLIKKLAKFIQKPIYLISLLLLSVNAAPVHAEGSKELTSFGGTRPFLMLRDATVGGITFKTTFQVSISSLNEVIDVGSSATGPNVDNGSATADGDIRLTSPSGAVFTCGASGTGVIPNRAAELAGPNTLPSAGANAFTPCTITPDATGIWQVEFIPPSPGVGTGTNNPPAGGDTSVGVDWTVDNNDGYIAAWDITVRNTQGTAATTDDVAIPGRAFTNYLALHMGQNDGVGTGGNREFNTQLFIQTQDGYRYRTKVNDLDPNGFIFFSNNQGFQNNTDPANILPMYRSISPLGAGFSLPAGVTFHSPELADNTATSDFTNQIFFNPIDTTLLKTTIGVDDINNFRFEGSEASTPGKMGTNPLGGDFKFTPPQDGTAFINIDANGDGDFTDPEDVTLTQFVEGNTEAAIFWDGTDGTGAKVPASDVAYGAQLSFTFGEVHFPLLDPENNFGGIEIQRLEIPSGSDPFLLDFNDDTSSIDPASIINSPTNSSGGIHTFTGNFGDNKGIDQWTFYISPPRALTDGITIREADLNVTKTVSPDTLIPGGTVTYTIAVTNGGPSDAQGVTVTDTIPSELTGVTWTCAVTNAGTSGATPANTTACGDASGSGNTINTTANLNNGATVTYTVTGTLDASVFGTITELSNTATITRPDDVTDPNDNDGNNTDNNRSESSGAVTAPIASEVADLSLAKEVDNTSPNVGDNITYTLRLTNGGQSTATNVQVTDTLPDGLTFVSVGSGGSYDATTRTITWNVASLANGGEATLDIVATVNTASGISNSAQVSASDQPDPDSTPGNNDSTEDDSASIGIGEQVADLSLAKAVNNTRPQIGENITYTLTLTNSGPNTATNVTISDTLPTGLDFVSVGDGGSYDATTRTITWDVASLANGGEVTLDIVATVNSADSIANSASVTAADQTDPDSTPGNTDTTEDDAASVTIDGEVADLSLTKTVNNSSPELGDNITYTLTLSNNGPDDASNVEVTEQLPAGLTYVSDDSGGTFNSSTGIWSVASLANGSQVSLNIVATVTSSESWANTASISASDQFDPDSEPGNNDSSEDDQSSATISPSTPSAQANLRMVKRVTRVNNTEFNGVVDDPSDANDNAGSWPSGYLQGEIDVDNILPGDEVEYTIYFLSDGTTTANNVRLCDIVPLNQTYVDNGFNNLPAAPGGFAGADKGMSVRFGTSNALSLTNANDGDIGQFYPSGRRVPGNPPVCPNINTPLNGNGAVVFDLGDVPNFSSDNENSFGFVRFRAIVD